MPDDPFCERWLNETLLSTFALYGESLDNPMHQLLESLMFERGVRGLRSEIKASRADTDDPEFGQQIGIQSKSDMMLRFQKQIGMRGEEFISSIGG